MNKDRNYYETLDLLGFSEPLTAEELEAYQQSEQREKDYPNIVFTNESYKKMPEDKIDLKELMEAFMLNQFRVTSSIKKCLYFFVVLAIINLVVALIAAFL